MGTSQVSQGKQKPIGFSKSVNFQAHDSTSIMLNS
jgi:hypothetical protein